MEQKVYCTECEYLKDEDVDIYSSKDDIMYKSGIKVVYICFKHNERLLNLYSNVICPCNKCNGEDFEFYTTGYKRLKPNIVYKL